MSLSVASVGLAAGRLGRLKPCTGPMDGHLNLPAFESPVRTGTLPAMAGLHCAAASKKLTLPSIRQNARLAWLQLSGPDCRTKHTDCMPAMVPLALTRHSLGCRCRMLHPRCMQPARCACMGVTLQWCVLGREGGGGARCASVGKHPENASLRSGMRGRC